YLRRELEAEEDAAGQGMLVLDESNAGRQAAVRPAAVRDLLTVLQGQLEDRRPAHLLADVEPPALRVLSRTEPAATPPDLEDLDGLEKRFGAAVDGAAQQAYAVIGHEVNLSSPKQLQEVLFTELDMPKTKKTKTGYTTDADALADLFAKTEHPFLAHLLAHRDAIRLRQTVEGLLRSVSPDGRIHTTF